MAKVGWCVFYPSLLALGIVALRDRMRADSVASCKMSNNGDALARIYGFHNTFPDSDCGGPIIALYVVFAILALAGLLLGVLGKNRA